MTVSIEHYLWGERSDGWYLIKRDDMSVIQEGVPAGGMEVMHDHNTAPQFFYICSCEFLVISVPSTRGDCINVET